MVKKIIIFMLNKTTYKKVPFICKGFIVKPKIANGNIRIASPKNAKRQPRLPPTYKTEPRPLV